jgi:hypothetical protein
MISSAIFILPLKAMRGLIPSRHENASSRLGKRDRAPELMRGKARVALERNTNRVKFSSSRFGLSRMFHDCAWPRNTWLPGQHMQDSRYRRIDPPGSSLA